MSSITHDAIVVGGGIVGSHCALQLADAGIEDVVILERDEPASKASGRAAGSLTIYGQERFGADASAFGREFYEDLASDHDNFTLHREDSYTITYTDDGADLLRHHHENLTIDSELLSPEEFAEQQPEFATDDARVVMRIPNTTYTDPRQLTLAVHEAARERGVDLRLEAVTELIPGEGGITVETSDATHGAPVVVIAAGAWSKRLLADVGVDIALRPRTSQIAILEPDDDLHVPRWSAPDFSIYGRPTPDGRVLFGGGVSTPITDLEGFATRALVPFLGEVAEYAPYVIPALERATLHDDWAGRVSATPDMHPYIGETKHDGLYVCAGFNGEGISNGPFGGRLLADLVVDRDPFADPSRFDPARCVGSTAFRIGNAVEWHSTR